MGLLFSHQSFYFFKHSITPLKLVPLQQLYTSRVVVSSLGSGAKRLQLVGNLMLVAFFWMLFEVLNDVLLRFSILGREQSQELRSGELLWWGIHLSTIFSLTRITLLLSKDIFVKQLFVTFTLSKQEKLALLFW